MARMLTEPNDFSIHDARIFLGFVGLLPAGASIWRRGWPPRGRPV